MPDKFPCHAVCQACNRWTPQTHTVGDPFLCEECKPYPWLLKLREALGIGWMAVAYEGETLYVYTPTPGLFIKLHVPHPEIAGRRAYIDLLAADARRAYANELRRVSG